MHWLGAAPMIRSSAGLITVLSWTVLAEELRGTRLCVAEPGRGPGDGVRCTDRTTSITFAFLLCILILLYCSCEFTCIINIELN